MFSSFRSHASTRVKINQNPIFHPDKYNEIFTITDLKEIYATEFPYELRRILDFYSNLNLMQDQAKIDDVAKFTYIDKNTEIGLEEIMEYVDLFSEKFIVGEIRRFDHNLNCGVSPSYMVSTFISYKKLESMDFYIYKNSKNEYVMCDMMWQRMTDFRKRRYFYWRKYKQYWI